MDRFSRGTSSTSSQHVLTTSPRSLLPWLSHSFLSHLSPHYMRHVHGVLTSGVTCYITLPSLHGLLLPRLLFLHGRLFLFRPLFTFACGWLPHPSHNMALSRLSARVLATLLLLFFFSPSPPLLYHPFPFLSYHTNISYSLLPHLAIVSLSFVVLTSSTSRFYNCGGREGWERALHLRFVGDIRSWLEIWSDGIEGG